MRKIGGLELVLLILLFTLFVIQIPAQPTPIEQSNISTGSPETRTGGIAGSITIQGGNITELNLTVQTQTPYWQGVWGQISYQLVLQDAANNTFYDWSFVNATGGELYFTNNSVQLFDTSITNATDQNISYAQTVYGWANSTATDNFTNTYNIANGHQAFNVGIVGGFEMEINASTAPAVNMQNDLFNGTVLWDSDNGGYPIFVFIINADQAAFNTRGAGFQALLPVRGVQATETFYIYAELE